MTYLSRREGEVLDIVYRLGRATTTGILDELADPITRPAIRSVLRILEEKGHIRHEEDGQKFVYLPTVPRKKASRSALRHIVNTFFDGSTASAMVALVDLPANELTDEDADRLEDLIRQMKKARKKR